MNRRDFLKLGTLSIPAIGSVSLEIYPQDDFSYDLFWKDVKKHIGEFSIQCRGLDISKHPALRKIPIFAYSRERFHIQVAQSWGCPPSTLSDMSYKDRVDVYAWYVSQKQIEAIEFYEQENKRKRDEG